MKTLARTAAFTALIGSISLANAHADGTSVYIAGKGKYCKETAVSGYLDCFYASGTRAKSTTDPRIFVVYQIQIPVRNADKSAAR